MAFLSHFLFFARIVLVLHVTWALPKRQLISGVLLRTVFLCTCPHRAGNIFLYCPALLPAEYSPFRMRSLSSFLTLWSRRQVTVLCAWHGQRPAFRMAGVGLCFWICFYVEPKWVSPSWRGTRFHVSYARRARSVLEYKQRKKQPQEQGPPASRDVRKASLIVRVKN